MLVKGEDKIAEVLEYRYALEVLESPFPIELNPTPVYDHSSVYIYRIFPIPITMVLTFKATGVSYVEVYDADTGRFLLPEKTEISEDTVFTIDWDGEGVFEPRVWKDSQVVGISLSFSLPEDEVIAEVKPQLRLAFVVLAAGAAVLIASVAVRLLRRKL